MTGTRFILSLAAIFCLLIPWPGYSRDPEAQPGVRAHQSRLQLVEAETEVRLMELELKMSELGVHEATVEFEKIKLHLETAEKEGNSREEGLAKLELKQAGIRVQMRKTQTEISRLQIQRAQAGLDHLRATLQAERHAGGDAQRQEIQVELERVERDRVKMAEELERMERENLDRMAQVEQEYGERVEQLERENREMVEQLERENREMVEQLKRENREMVEQLERAKQQQQEITQELENVHRQRDELAEQLQHASRERMERESPKLDVRLMRGIRDLRERVEHAERERHEMFEKLHREFEEVRRFVSEHLERKE